MARKTGGTRVGAGFYWRPEQWEIVPLSGAGGVLPGGPEEGYYKIPTLAMLLLAPVMGALFVVFLPFVGFAILLNYLARAAWTRLGHAALQTAALVSPSWRPGEAYFAGKGKDAERKGAVKDAKTEERLDTLEKEIEEKRKDA
jgi:hypothetical protein